MSLILIVEDEIELANVVAKYLQIEGLQTHQIHVGTGVVEWVKENRPDVILLDWMLPGKDGLTICKEICEFSDIPIIMATAKVDEIDRLIGLESGADDYVCKPYSAKEVVARVKVRLRRLNKQDDSDELIRMDENQLSVSAKDNSIKLTSVEFELLSLFFNSKGRIFSRQHIMDVVYTDFRVVSNRTIDSHVRNLRNKLAQIVPDRELIHSIYSVGYKYELD